MGYIDFNQQTGAVEITYGGKEAPFAGVDATAPDPYIGPNQLTKDSINALVNNNTLVATFFTGLSALTVSSDTIIGFGDLNGQVFSVSVDASFNVNIYGYPQWPTTAGNYLIASIPTSTIFGSAVSFKFSPNTLSYKNINGICYFSFPGCPFIFQHNNLTGALLTSNLGCSFLSEFNGRLIAANVWQINAQIANYASPAFGSQITTEASNVGGGTTTSTSSGYGSFPSIAVSAGQVVNLTVNLSGGFAAYPSNAPGCYGSAQFQYSKDSGATWTTFYTWNATEANFALPSQNIAASNLTGITNIDTIQVRVIASATASSGNSASLAAGLNGATVSIITKNSLVVQNFPYQYAWSAPQGQYSQFNPTTTDSNGNLIVTGAGYNNLPDVEDSITGLFNTGPTQFVLRAQGVTEVTALSNGINPFEFDHLWASHKGIGTIFPNTVGQYGSMGAFFSDTGDYTFGYEGINEITGKATSGIYTDLIGTCASNLLSGGMGPIYINGEVYLARILTAFDSTTNVLYAWLWNSKTKEWYRFQMQLSTACVGIQVIGVNLGSISQTKANSVYIVAILATLYTAVVMALPIDGSVNEGFFPNLGEIPSNFIFSAEEIKFNRDVTINGIGVYYKCIDPALGQIIGVPSISGTVFESLDSTNPNVIFDDTWRYVLLSPPSSGGLPFTGKAPQLNLAASVTGSTSASGKFKIGKIVLIGSVDVTQEIGNE